MFSNLSLQKPSKYCNSAVLIYLCMVRNTVDYCNSAVLSYLCMVRKTVEKPSSTENIHTKWLPSLQDTEALLWWNFRVTLFSFPTIVPSRHVGLINVWTSDNNIILSLDLIHPHNELQNLYTGVGFASLKLFPCRISLYPSVSLRRGPEREGVSDFRYLSNQAWNRDHARSTVPWSWSSKPTAFFLLIASSELFMNAWPWPGYMNTSDGTPATFSFSLRAFAACKTGETDKHDVSGPFSQISF